MHKKSKIDNINRNNRCSNEEIKIRSLLLRCQFMCWSLIPDRNCEKSCQLNNPPRITYYSARTGLQMLIKTTHLHPSQEIEYINMEWKKWHRGRKWGCKKIAQIIFESMNKTDTDYKIIVPLLHNWLFLSNFDKWVTKSI